jgi:ribonuclease PH
MTRKDGRKADQLRPVRITPDFTKFAEGSCLIEIGNTMVLCNASVEEKVPSHVKSGGWITAEYSMLPRANRTRSPRDVSKLKLAPRSAEIQRLIGRSLRGAVDLSLLGERTITVDCDVLQGDGGTRTASVTGGFLALALALSRLVDAGQLEQMPIRSVISGVSAGIVGDEALLDLCYEEDSCAAVDLNCVMTADSRIIELQATGEGRPYTVEEEIRLVELCRKGNEELCKLLKRYVKL